MVNAKLVAKVNSTDTVLVDNQNLTTDVKVSLERTLDGKQTTWFSGTIKGTSGPSPNIPPTIDVPASVTGTVNTEIALIARVTDSDGTVDDVNWKQKTGIGITDLVQTDNDGIYTAKFTPTQAGNYSFEVEAFDNKNARVAKTVAVTVNAIIPPPPPPPPTGNIIFDSKRDTKLHDGQVRTITKEGDISPGKLGVECRASGSPKIVVNADRTFSLVSGSGGVDNLSLKLRSRHNEGGDCSNRFGGFGCSIDKSALNMKTESCHNNHENSLSKSHGVNINDGQFHTIEFECKDDGSAVAFVAWVDGVQKMTGKHNSPKAFYLDKASFQKNSYFWLRLNNGDHGRIYVYALNYNSKLKAVFKFDASKNAIVFKEVILAAV